MSKQITLNWSKSTKIVGKNFPEDKLGRQRYAEFLTKFLAKEGFDKARLEGEQKKNYVLNLNSEWGSGKTYFLRRWADDLEVYYPVVYIDAWKQDYSDDPLMTVVSSLIKQLREQSGKSEKDPVFNMPKKLVGLLKAAAPSIAKELTKRYIGIDPVAIMEADDDDIKIGELKDEDGNPVLDDNNNPVDMSSAASSMVKHLINEHDAKSKAIDSLKKSVEEWVEAVIGTKKTSYPAFIFIDELDRCRPSYAVAMLETIKHIFDIKGVVFVIATDTEQLQHAVKAIYGEGFNARVYLSRFFNSRFSLREPDFEGLLDVHCDSYKLSGEYLRDLGVKILPWNDNSKLTLQNITSILDAFGVSARTAIQIAERVISIITNLPRGSKVDILMLTSLLCFREGDQELYDEIMSGDFKRTVTKGDSTNTIYLKDFLQSYFPNKDRYIRFEFEPAIYGDFQLNQVRSHLNNYPDGIYSVSLRDYFDTIFSSHLAEQKQGGVWGLTRREQGLEKTDSQKVDTKLYELKSKTSNYKELYFGEAASLWLKALYLKDSYHEVSNSYYQDLVELASALDWMDEDFAEQVNN